MPILRVNYYALVHASSPDFDGPESRCEAHYGGCMLLATKREGEIIVCRVWRAYNEKYVISFCQNTESISIKIESLCRLFLTRKKQRIVIVLVCRNSSHG
jgi:hypothetical protein